MKRSGAEEGGEWKWWVGRVGDRVRRKGSGGGGGEGGVSVKES